ncbi:MAG: hypothetical protein N2555_01385 [Endomicrobia bacterium]|nr:hypothetical protein [Endomicrobiia bacterium]
MKIFFYTLTFVLTLFLPSCRKPTYPKEKLVLEAKKLLKKEGNLEGELKLVEKTMFLRVDIPKEEIITEDKKLLQKAIKRIEKASIIITRLALSTDAEVEFLVTIAKVKNQDFCIRIINYLQDIKDLIYMKISRGDYEKRIVFEMLPYSKIAFQEINFNEFIGRLVASNYNMFIRSNPFAGALLSKTLLEFERIENNDVIFLSINTDIDIPAVKLLFESLVREYFLDIKKRYKTYQNLPHTVVVTDKKGKYLAKIKN